MSEALMSEILGSDEMFLIEDAELASQVSDEQLESVQKLGDRHLQLNNLAEKLEEQLKKVKEANRVVTDDLLPKKLMQIGLKSFTLATGETIEMSTVVQANMPKAETPEYPKAINWLDRNDLGDIIKKDVIAKFGRGEGDMAKRVMDIVIRETNGQAPVELKESVNYMTLNSVLKKRMQDGLPMPRESDDGFSIYMGPRAKIVKKKAK